MSLHIRNPIKRHGDNPTAQFVMIPNELARDTTLSNHAYRIAIEIRTHAEDFEVSMASIAKAHGWSRTKVKEAFGELVTSGWLAKRQYVNASGHRVFDEYHFDVSRRFTHEESIEWNRQVILRATHDSVEPIPLNSGGAGGCAEPEHPPVPRGDIKEDQQEHQIEHEREDQPFVCWICGGTGIFECGPCAMCSPRPITHLRTAAPPPTSNESTCFGCKTLGPESCLTHTSSPVGRLQLGGKR